MLKLLETLLPLLQPIALAVLSLGVKVLSSIRHEIRELARIAERMQQWREDHENRHDRDAEVLNREFDQIHKRLANGNGKDYNQD
jgi:hypothetical protein